MYGFLIALAIFVSLYISEKTVERKGLSKDLLWQVSFWTVLFGIVGARMYHVLDFWEVYSTNPASILQLWHGGMGIFGALAGGGIALSIFLKSKGENIWEWLDVVVIPLPLAQAIGRWGNYFNFELLPYALYESAADFTLFLIILKLSKRKGRPGITFLSYLSGYSLIRLFLEPVRQVSWTLAGLNVAQSISILALLVSIGILIKWKLKTK